MTNERIKEILLDIADTKLDFSVIQSGKKSKRVHGLYKTDTHEIILHNKNFKTDNELIYTAIHEYAHHLLTEDFIAKFGDTMLTNSRVHTQEFWAKFNELLLIAEKKKHYVLSISMAPELVSLTEDIKKNYLEKNGELMQKFGRLLEKAYELCEASNIRYEDYIDRILCLPKTAARNIRKIGMEHASPSLGFENMKFVASLRNSDDKAVAEKKLLEGNSPDGVRSFIKSKYTKSEDEKTKLEREKKRIERTIEQLQKRLKFVESTLEKM